MTVDIDPRADCYVDSTQPLPFADWSIDGIFCEEMIEHISKEAAARMLRECLRVMKPGAPIRLTTPDLDWFCSSLVRGSIHCDEINDIFYKHRHVYLYSRQELEDAMRACGFADIRRSTYKDSNAWLGHFDSHPVRFGHSPDNSQFVEARRPPDV